MFSLLMASLIGLVIWLSLPRGDFPQAFAIVFLAIVYLCLNLVFKMWLNN